MKEIYTKEDASNVYLRTKSYTIPYGITEIAANAFNGQEHSEEIIIPGTVKVIEAGAFEGSKYLKKVVMHEGVEDIRSDAFNGCTVLKDIEFPKTIKRIGIECFKNCQSLQKIKLNEGLEYLGAKAFEGCEYIYELYIPGSLKTVKREWKLGELLLSEVTLGEGIKSIEKYAFQGSKNLEKINLPDSLETIEEGAFASCRSLRSIKIPKNVQYIQYGAFEGCSELSQVELPDSLLEIGPFAFRGTKVRELTISAHVRTFHIMNSLARLNVRYNNFQELFAFVKNNKKELERYYQIMNKEYITFIGPNLSTFEIGRLAFLLNHKSYTLEEPKQEEIEQPISNETTTIYTNNREVDKTITKINRMICSFPKPIRDSVKSELDAAIEELKKEENPSDNYNIYRPEIAESEKKKAIKTNIQHILNNLELLETHNDLIKQIDYYQALVNGYIFKPKTNDKMSKMIVEILEILNKSPEKYQEIIKEQLKKILDTHRSIVTRDLLDSYLNNHYAYKPAFDYCDELFKDIDRIHSKVCFEEQIINYYLGSIDALKGRGNHFCLMHNVHNTIVDDLDLIRKIVDLLPEGKQKEDLKLLYENKLEFYLGELSEQLLNYVGEKDENRKHFIEVEEGILDSIEKMESTLEKIYLPSNYIIEDYESIASLYFLKKIVVYYETPEELLKFIKNNKEALHNISIRRDNKIFRFVGPVLPTINEIALSLLIDKEAFELDNTTKDAALDFKQHSLYYHINHHDINELINTIIKMVEPMDPSIKRIISGNIAKIKRMYREATETNTFDNPKEIIDLIIKRLKEMINRINNVNSYNELLKQADYYQDLLDGIANEALENDFLSEDIVLAINSLNRFPKQYREALIGLLKIIIDSFRKNIYNAIGRYLEMLPHLSFLTSDLTTEDYRADLVKKINERISTLDEKLSTMQQYYSLLNAFEGRELIDCNDFQYKSLLRIILLLPKIIYFLPEGEVKEEINKEYEQLKKESIEEILRLSMKSDPKEYNNFLKEFVNKLIKVINKITEYQPNKTTTNIEIKVERILNIINFQEYGDEIKYYINYINSNSNESIYFPPRKEHISEIILRTYKMVINDSRIPLDAKNTFKKEFVDILNKYIVIGNKGESGVANYYNFYSLWNELDHLMDFYFRHDFSNPEVNNSPKK